MSELLRTWLHGLLEGLPPAQPTQPSKLDPELLERLMEGLRDYAPERACVAMRQSLAVQGGLPASGSTLWRHAVSCTPCALAVLEHQGGAPGLLSVDQVELLLWITEPVRAFHLEEHPELAVDDGEQRSAQQDYSALERVMMARHAASAAQSEARVHRVMAGRYHGADGHSYGYADEVGSSGGPVGAPRSMGESGGAGDAHGAESGPIVAPPSGASLELESPGLHLLVLGPAGLVTAPPPGLGALLRACTSAQIPILLLPGDSGSLEERVLATAERVRGVTEEIWGWDECFLEPTALLLQPGARRGTKAWQLGMAEADGTTVAGIVGDLSRLLACGEPEALVLNSPLWSGPAQPFWLPEAGERFLARFGAQDDGSLGRSSSPWRAYAPWTQGHAHESAGEDAADGLLHELEAMLDVPDASPVFLLAPPGGGKSRLLRRWLALRQAAHPEAVLVSRFFSDDVDASVTGALCSLWDELAAACDVGFLAPRGRLAIRDGFPTLLAACGQAQSTTVVLDGLEDLDPGLDDLDWIPARVPAGVTLLVSVSTGIPAAERLIEQRRRAGAGRLLELAPIQGIEARRELARGVLERLGASLPASRVELALHFEGSGNPLFLEVLLGSMVALQPTGWLDRGGDLVPGRTAESCFDACLSALEQGLEPGALTQLREQLAQLVVEPAGLTLEPVPALRPFTRRMDGRTRLLHPCLLSVARRWSKAG